MVKTVRKMTMNVSRKIRKATRRGGKVEKR